MRGVLDACAFRLRMGYIKDAYGPTIEYFLSIGLKPSDIELFILNMEKNLRALRVEIVEKPEYIPEYQIDEAKLINDLRSNIAYHNEQALQRDVDSVSAVMRLRKGLDFYEVEDCHAIFVTTNNALVKISREFFYKDASVGAIPPCVPDYVLTNLLWLKTPLTAPNLPRKRVIADCYAATQPDDKTWRKYLTAIQKHEEADNITADDYVLLRHAIEAKSAMMDITLGEEVAFTQGTITEILDLARTKIQHEKNVELSGERSRRELAEDENRRIRAEKAAEDQERMQRIKTRAQRYAYNISRVAEYGLLALLFIGTLSTFPWNFPSFSANFMKYLISPLQFMILILSVSSLYFGTTVVTWVRRFEVAIAHQIEIWLTP